ncbi:filamentous hemagglutinin N-terminal domain-containing protein [Leptolyngbya cf. ectocarpi LEGE 11479]|uniref:Filamentous hemagglutinin N-terminal domain-containing protein n=1 Tax=Leptolyngbya cf. ectocarpi LEGE 11479 TaxID=1828722 RepID=A0A928ZZ34_LEPEC|nr:filamentous hemagglutinin N-terminal domain-containing protein [Leptolyngbya ectocarpi]MBE9070063.1 filamentous hemagglutinin N-terminal domain-containing protein [Leptolyngbya cf. ectocarpi LEGE 11479]
MAHCLSVRWFQFALVIITGHIATAAYAITPGSAASQTEVSKPNVVFNPESSSLTTEILVTQIIPDNTLGHEQSTVSDSHEQTHISGGAIQGPNLFHSFEEFNVNTGQHVYFVNPDSIETILSRVTGSNISDIDGLLGVDGNANLFLLNPNGISFGPNAQLDIRGSFTASTAETVVFADNSTFSAVNPQGTSLLTMSVPLGVQFSDHLQGAVTNQGILQTGQDLTLAGQNLYLERQLTAGKDLSLQAQDTVTIRDTETDAFLARSGQNLTIQGNQAIDILTLQHLEQLPFVSGENLVLVSDGAISADAHLESGGNVQFSTLQGTPGNFISLYDPIISANGDVILGDYNGVALKIEATGSIQADEIIITGPDLLLQADGSGSDEDLLASSRAVILRAGVDALNGNEPPETIGGTTTPIGTIADNPIGSIIINGDISAFNNGGNGGDADDGGPIILTATGNIDINGNLVSFAQSSPLPGNDSGDGGLITLTADGDINVDGNFLSFSQALPNSGGSAGDAGSVTLTADGDIDIDGFFISFSQTGENSGGNAGNGGAITLTANGNINAPRNFLSHSEASSGNAGNGGDISITSTSGDITTSGSLNTISFADSGANNAGNGGDITIFSDAGHISTLEELITFSTSVDGDSGAGGTISITSNSGNILNEGNLAANSLAENGNSGPGGNISIASGFGDIIANGRINTFSFAPSLLNASNGGTVSISSDSGDIMLNERISSLSSSTLGNANNGGDVSILSISGDISTSDINSSSSLFVPFFQNIPVDITTADTITGDGGDILIRSTSGDIVTNGFLSSSSFSRDGNVGDSGNISLLTKEGTIRGNSQISAVSISELDDITGDGGNVTLQANRISDLEIRTISSAGASGNVAIQSTTDGLTANNLRLITSGQLEISHPIFPNQPFFLDLSDFDFDQSGRTTISSSNDLILNNVELLSDANRVADAGNVELRSNGTIQLNNSRIFSDTKPQSSGNGGDIIIAGDNNITLNNSIITTGTDGDGRAGNILITAPLLTIQNDTKIIGETSSLKRGGIGGDIIVQADGINLSGDNTEISVNTSRVAAAGNITLIPLGRGSLQVSTIGDGAQISASTEIGSSGRGGNITIRDADSVLLSNTEILTSGDGSGAAGSIFIQDVGEFVMRRTSLILAAANQTGRGGNVDIDAGFILTIPEEDNDILATANVGQGGTVSITANLINGFREVELFNPSLRGNRISDISARSNFGFDGTVTLESESNPELTELPTNLSDPANRIAQTCSTEVGAVVDGLTGDFSMTGRGGQLLSPADIASQYGPLEDLGPAATEKDSFSTVNIMPESHSPATNLQTQTPLLDAQEALVTASGDIFLVTEHRWHPPSSCTP